MCEIITKKRKKEFTYSSVERIERKINVVERERIPFGGSSQQLLFQMMLEGQCSERFLNKRWL